MIPNLINVVLGLWLAYAVMLDPPLLESPWVLVISAVVIFALALWARRSDHHPWQSTLNMALAAVLLVLAAIQYGLPASELVHFWGVFFAGILVSIFALWAALYRPRAKPDKR